MTTGAFTTVPVAPLPFERFGEIMLAADYGPGGGSGPDGGRVGAT